MVVVSSIVDVGGFHGPAYVVAGQNKSIARSGE
jgi:hypothetical protein